MRRILIGVMLLVPLLGFAQAEKSAAPAGAKAEKRPQFLIILRLVPRLHDDKAWTKEDTAAVGAHFRRLQEAAKSGDVILAGRTSEAGDRTMGLVVFEAENETAARIFMEGDPCIVGGQMTGELRPYSVAILRK